MEAEMAAIDSKMDTVNFMGKRSSLNPRRRLISKLIVSQTLLLISRLSNPTLATARRPTLHGKTNK
jgi:hypothetical protein